MENQSENYEQNDINEINDPETEFPVQDTPDDEQPDVIGDPSEIEEAGRPVTEGEDIEEDDDDENDIEDADNNTTDITDQQHNAGNARMSVDEEGSDVSSDEQV